MNNKTVAHFLISHSAPCDLEFRSLSIQWQLYHSSSRVGRLILIRDNRDHPSVVNQRRDGQSATYSTSLIDRNVADWPSRHHWRRWLTTVSCLSATTLPIDHSDGIPFHSVPLVVLFYYKVFLIYYKVFLPFSIGFIRVSSYYEEFRFIMNIRDIGVFRIPMFYKGFRDSATAVYPISSDPSFVRTYKFENSKQDVICISILFYRIEIESK